MLQIAANAKSLQSCPTLWDSPGKNTGVGCHFLLQCFKGHYQINEKANHRTRENFKTHITQ